MISRRTAKAKVPGWGVRFLPAALLLLLTAGGCASLGTPYQPRDEDGWGYDQSRLQERMYRVSFKGNRDTEETDVMDFLFLRCAEVTLENGFTHFVIKEDYGRTQASLQQTGPRTSVGVGFGSFRPHSFFSLGFGVGTPVEAEVHISYHLAMFVIRMLTPQEAEREGAQAYQADFLVKSLTPKKEKSLQGR